MTDKFSMRIGRITASSNKVIYMCRVVGSVIQLLMKQLLRCRRLGYEISYGDNDYH